MQNLVSIGHAAVLLQTDVPAVKNALDFIGAEPTLVIDGVPHYLAAEVRGAGLALLGKPSLRFKKEPAQ